MINMIVLLVAAVPPLLLLPSQPLKRHDFYKMIEDLTKQAGCHTQAVLVVLVYSSPSLPSNYPALTGVRKEREY